MKLALVLCSALLCSATLFAQEQAPPANPNPPAPQATASPAASAAPAATDSALLHVYRQHRYAGSALAPSIYLDDKQIARVGSGRRVTIRLTPGSHTVRSDDKSSAISLDAKPGQDYYVRVDEETGFWKGHGKLTLLLPEQGAAEYKLQKPVEPDRRFNKELIVEDSDAPADKKK
jgi:hypothetical protein